MGVDLLTATLLAALSGPVAHASGGSAPQPGCPTRLERLDLLDEGEKALFAADFGTTETKLRALEGALSCGPLAEVELLARMWLLEGAWYTRQGAPDQGADSFRAAARISAATWVSGYGSELRAAYESAIASSAAGSTTLVVEPDIFRWIGAIDGEVTRFPATVAPGLHLVQVGASESDVRFSRIVVAFPDSPVVVVTGLHEPTGTEVRPAPAPVAGPAPRKVVQHPPLALHAAVGASASFGADPEGDETGAKLAIPLEAGVVWHPINPLWTRVALTGGPLLTGAYPWTDGDVATTSPSLLGAHAAGGFAANQGGLGLLAGWQWPGRAAIRGVLYGALPKVPIRVEARIGLNVPTAGTPETAIDLFVDVVPRLVRGRKERSEEAE
jgi:hypothetical protein